MAERGEESHGISPRKWAPQLRVGGVMQTGT
jgi:hypothetical protein